MWSARRSFDVQRKGKAAEASKFAQTCSLLSRYVKEKGSLRDLNLEIGGKVESLETLVKPGSSVAGKSPEEHSPVVPMEDASNKATTRKGDPSSQLTIFYAGKVLVFEDYPANKLKELVSAAKKSSSQMSYGIASYTTTDEKPSPPQLPASCRKRPLVDISSNTCKMKMKATDEAGPSTSNACQSEANGSELPIARRSSLNRFLEKRKDRGVCRGPNQQNPKDEQQIDLNTFPQKE